MEEGLEDAMCVARTTVCQHVCTVLCGCVSSWSSHIRCRCKVVCSPVMFPLAPCDKLALPLTHPVPEKCVCTYLVSLPVLFKSPVLAFYDRIYNTLEHLQRRDTNELVRTQQPSLCCINWRHCMHALLLHCPLSVPCMLRWDNHVVPHCLHRAFVSPCSPA